MLYFGPYRMWERPMRSSGFWISSLYRVPMRLQSLLYHLGQCMTHSGHELFQKGGMEVSDLGQDDVCWAPRSSKDRRLPLRKNIRFERAAESTIQNGTLPGPNSGVLEPGNVFGYYVDRERMCVQIFFCPSEMADRARRQPFSLLQWSGRKRIWPMWAFSRRIPTWYNDHVQDIVKSGPVDTKIKPQRGEKKQLVNLAIREMSVWSRSSVSLKIWWRRPKSAIENLGKLQIPTCAESLWHHGDQSVLQHGGLFVNGKPRNKDYRKYKIRSCCRTEMTMPRESFTWTLAVMAEAPPDLIVIDG